MPLIAVIALVVALIVQSQRSAERETVYQAEIRRLRMELDVERSQIVQPNPGNLTDQ
jgi:hypothetical protein